MNKKYLKQLSDLEHERACLRSPSMPRDYVPRHKYIDNTANGLTRCVVDWINFNGGQAERISTTGRVIDNSKVVTDVMGSTRKIGSSKWIKGTGRNGSADISSTIPVTIAGQKVGISAKWEVKQKDTQRKEQIEYQQEVENAGGHYFIVHDFEEFMFYYNGLLHYYSQLEKENTNLKNNIL